MSFLDPITSGSGKATDLVTNDPAILVHVASADPPFPGQVLTADEGGNATWEDPASVDGGYAAGLIAGGDGPGTHVNVSLSGVPSAGQTLIATDATHATWQTPAVVTPTPAGAWTGKPITPGTYDDEFLPGGSADFATRGYIVWNATDSVVMTRAGEVDLTLTARALGSTTYRSSLANSCMFVQIPFGKLVQIYKAFTPGTSGYFYARMGVLHGDSSAAPIAWACLWPNSAGRPTDTGRLYMYVRQVSGSFVSSGVGQNAGSDLAATGNVSSTQGYVGSGQWIVRHAAPDQLRLMWPGSDGMSAFGNQAFQTGPTIASMAYIGFALSYADDVAGGSQSLSANGLCVLDFIRYKTPASTFLFL